MMSLKIQIIIQDCSIITVKDKNAATGLFFKSTFCELNVNVKVDLK